MNAISNEIKDRVLKWLVDHVDVDINKVGKLNVEPILKDCDIDFKTLDTLLNLFQDHG